MEFQRLANFRQIPGTKIYRSARPDNMTSDDLDLFKNKLNIKRIIDLRSCLHGAKEFANATGEKLVDDVYELYHLQTSKATKQPELTKLNKNGQLVNTKQKSQYPCEEELAHFVIDLHRHFGDAVQSNMSTFNLFRLGILYAAQKALKTNHATNFICDNLLNIHGLIGLYKYTIDFCGDEVCLVLNLLSEGENVPALINCTLGKDRTGIIAALILCVIGADRHTIAEDYATTAESYASIPVEIATAFKSYNLNSSFTEAKYETMIQLLEYIDEKYGSVGNYLDSIGFDCTSREKLAANVKLV